MGRSPVDAWMRRRTRLSRPPLETRPHAHGRAADGLAVLPIDVADRADSSRPLGRGVRPGSRVMRPGDWRSAGHAVSAADFRPATAIAAAIATAPRRAGSAAAPEAERRARTEARAEARRPGEAGDPVARSARRADAPATDAAAAGDPGVDEVKCGVTDESHLGVGSCPRSSAVSRLSPSSAFRVPTKSGRRAAGCGA